MTNIEDFKYTQHGGLFYNNESEVGEILLSDSFRNESVVIRLDIISDWIAGLQKIYDGTSLKELTDDLDIVIPIDSLELSIRTANAIKNQEIFTANELEYVKESELKKISNFGPKHLNELIAEVGKHGIKVGSKFGLELPDNVRAFREAELKKREDRLKRMINKPWEK